MHEKEIIEADSMQSNLADDIYYHHNAAKEWCFH